MKSIVIITCLAFVMGVSADESKDFSPPTQEVLNLLGRDETSPVLTKFVEKYSMKRNLMKELNYDSPEVGVSVLFRDKTIWRVVLIPQVYKQGIPLGIARDLPSKELFTTYQGSLHEGYPNGPDDFWFVVKRNGFVFNIVYDKGKFDRMYIDKDDASIKPKAQQAAPRNH
jgi:hypothetical protein